MRRIAHGAFWVVFLVVVGASAGSARPSSDGSARREAGLADHGTLQQFSPRSAGTWWAIVTSNLHGTTWVVRTTNSGRQWRAVTPPVKRIASASFLGTGVAFVEADSLHPGEPNAPREPVYRTL